jgi:hypothetical protein
MVHSISNILYASFLLRYNALCKKRKRGVILLGRFWQMQSQWRGGYYLDTIWLTNRFLFYIRKKNFALKSALVELSAPCAQGRRGLEFIPI